MTEPHDDQQPEVLEACWDREKIKALFRDLKQGAEVSQVQVRTSSVNSRAQDSLVTLDQAQELLDDVDTTAIQIYYKYDDQSWCDTLMVLPDTIRIIRTILPSTR